MAKVMKFTVEVPGDDLVKAEAVKAVLLEAIRALNAKPMAGKAVDGETLPVAETQAFFNAASVKTFVTYAPRKSTAAPQTQRNRTAQS